jgi:hypothetical protein
VEAWCHGERPKPVARVMRCQGCGVVPSPATAPGPGASATMAAH